MRPRRPGLRAAVALEVGPVEQLAAVGLLEDRREAGGGEGLGEVEQRAREGGDREAVDARDVGGVDGARAVDGDAVEVARTTGRPS